MALFSIEKVRIDGVSACVPRNSVSNLDYALLTERERQLFVKTTGIEKRRLADKNITTSDLCFHAAEKLIEELGWDKSEIGLLIFVTQSADYIIPATAPILQDRLGLSMQTMAFDINLGCSGYVYGLSVASSLVSSQSSQKGPATCRRRFLLFGSGGQQNHVSIVWRRRFRDCAFVSGRSANGFQFAVGWIWVRCDNSS